MLLREPLVSFTATFLNPSFEVFSDARVNHIADISAGHLSDLSQDWQRVYNFSVSKPVIKDEVKRKIFILRYRDHLNFITIDSLCTIKRLEKRVNNIPSWFRSQDPLSARSSQCQIRGGRRTPPWRGSERLPPSLNTSLRRSFDRPP